MGLLDDILNATPNGSGMGLTSYLPPNLPAPDTSKKAATADELAIALGLNNIGNNQDAAAPAPAAPGVISASAPGATQVPISQSNFTPPASTPTPAPMTSPVSAPQFGANPSPYLFPQSAAFGGTPPALAPTFGQGASPLSFPQSQAFGNSPPAPTPPVVAVSDDDEEDTPAVPAQASPIRVGNVNVPRIGPASAFTPQAAPAAAPTSAAPVAPTAAPSPLSGAGDHAKAAWQSMRNGGGLIGGISAAITGQRDDPVATFEGKQAATANVTAKALLAKGIDPQIVAAAVQPGNGELLKTLIESAFKTKDPMNLGSGYVLRPGATKAERLFEPDDKTPAGFTKADDGTMHFTPGGPADPVYLRLAEAQKKDPNANIVLGRGGEIVKNNPDGTVTVMHKNEAEAPVPMDPNALEILARREIGGDFSGRKNLGRGAQGAADLKAITNKSSDILTNEMGMSPTDAAAHLLKKQQEYLAQGQGLNSEARTTGVREANLNLILKAADAAIPAALEASDKVSRTGFVPLNQIIQHGEVMTSDPALKSFGMANLQLAEHWARAMNPTGVMRESDRDKALSFLSTADSKETYKTAVGQLRTQIERERDAVKSSRGMSDLPGSATSQPGAPKAPVKIDGYTITEH